MFVKTWMTPEPKTAKSSMSLADALKRMEEGRFRRLPVVDDGKLVGIVGSADAQLGLAAAPPKTVVADVMTPNPLTVGADEPIENAAHLMCRNKVSALPVLQGRKVVGIVTESDIFEAFTIIMGGGRKGVRVTFDLEEGSDELEDILRIANRYSGDVFSIATFEPPGKGRRWVTLRVSGERLDKMVDSFWKSGYRVLQVLVDGKPVAGA